MPRLLVCRDCKTLDRLPDYDGPPEHDAALSYVIERHHTYGDGLTHIGSIMHIPQKDYDRLGDHTQLSKELFDAEDEARASRDTFNEDANKCFNRHHRPDMGCIDYMEDSKRIGTPTRHPGIEPMYLCHFCPVHHGYVVVEQRWRAGQYKEN